MPTRKKKADRPRSRQLPLMVYPKDLKNIELIQQAYQARDRSASICRALEDLVSILQMQGSKGETCIRDSESLAIVAQIRLPRAEFAK